MKIVTQSTSKPNLNELRKIDGVVKIWNGEMWVKDAGQFFETVKKELKCEGNCLTTHGQHKGVVKPVTVYGNTWHPMTFNYCDNAIEEDNNRGFSVVEYDADLNNQCV